VLETLCVPLVFVTVPVCSRVLLGNTDTHTHSHTHLLQHFISASELHYLST